MLIIILYKLVPANENIICANQKLVPANDNYYFV